MRTRSSPTSGLLLVLGVFVLFFFWSPGQKLLLSALFPAVFAFSVTAGEMVGGVIMLVGVGVATLAVRSRADR